MTGSTQSLDLEYGVTREQACIMCHLSSECGGCCLTCKKEGGCQGQACSQPFRDHEGARFETWMWLVKTFYPHLKRFVPKEYLTKVIKSKMKHKVFGYYETGEELLVPITGWRAAVVRVEEAEI